MEDRQEAGKHNRGMPRDKERKGAEMSSKDMHVLACEVLPVMNAWLDGVEEAGFLKDLRSYAMGKVDRENALLTFQGAIVGFCIMNAGRVEEEVCFDIKDGEMKSVKVKGSWDTNGISVAKLTKKSKGGKKGIMDNPLMVILDYNKETTDARVLMQLVPDGLQI